MNKYVKSPLNYTGGKYKLLPQIIPLISTDKRIFVDLFGGGFNVGVNTSYGYMVYNDINKQVCELLYHFYTEDVDHIDSQVVALTEKYNLDSKEKSEHADLYLQLRDEYNKDRDWLKFYVLITSSFSNMIRFNKKGEFNAPCGKRGYNPILQKRLREFIKRLQEKDITFCNQDFRDVIIDENCFVYCDPPYYNSVAAYNENGGWSDQDEQDLLDLLDDINSFGGQFALSNNFKYDNPILKEWALKRNYPIYSISANYGNCNYHKKDRTPDREVLITNYKVRGYFEQS